jgi:hypothetical protein
MKHDSYGNPIFNEKDLLNAYMSVPDLSLRKCYVDRAIEFDPILDITNKPDLVEYIDPNMDKTTFDQIAQNIWLMPEYYKTFDIAAWVLAECNNQDELQRAGKELIMFQQKELLPLLQYIKYLVDTMRANNIVWGVGRGSSVSSFVLFLIGIHRVNSLYFDLDIADFLKN